MVTDPNRPTVPDPTAGLSDPRHLANEPDLFTDPTAGGTGPNPAPESDSADPGSDTVNEVGGLVDPRAEAAGPEAVEG